MYSDIDPTEADVTALNMLLDELAVRLVADLQRKNESWIEFSEKKKMTK